MHDFEAMTREQLIAELEATRKELSRQAIPHLGASNSLWQEKAPRMRQEAEEELAKLRHTFPGFEFNDTGELLHELNVYQVELEMQNEELRASQQQLQVANAYRAALFANAPVGYVVLDQNGLIKETNATAVNLFEYPHDLVGASLTLFMEQEQAMFFEQARKRTREGLTESCEVKYSRFKEAIARWLRVYISLVRDEQLESPVYLCALMDITAEKNYELNLVMAKKAVDEEVLRQTMELSLANKHLQESESKFRTYFESAGDGILISDIDSNIVQANPKAAHILGYKSEKSLVGLNGRDLIHPDDLAVKPLATLSREAQTSGTVFSERRFLCASGEYIPVEATIRFIPDTRLHHVIFRDVSERRKAEEMLRQSEQRFRMLLEDIDMVAVQGYTPDLKVVYWNKASENLYGYTCEEALGKIITELIIPPTMQDEVKKLVKDWVEKKRRIPAGEFWLQKKDGTLVPVYSSHVLLQNFHNETELYCIDVELTAVKRAQDALLQAKEDVVAAHRAKGEFLANMSHELRTPLNGIMGMLQIIQDVKEDAQRIKYITLALKSGRRLASLLGNILEISKSDAGVMQLEKSRFFFREMLTEVCDLFHAEAATVGVAFNSSVHPDIPEQVTGDPLRLQQILTNLIGNAFKFTSEGSVNVEAYPLPALRKGQARVLFSIADTGCGMPEEAISFLFKPFTQGSQGRQKKYQGAGLGLAISRRLILLMGGHIAAESRLNEGTTIHFCVSFDA